MNTAEYFSRKDTGATITLKEAFTEWCKRRGVSRDNVSWAECLDFARSPAKTVLQYQIGHLFTVVGLIGEDTKFNGCLATVKGFHIHANSIEPDTNHLGDQLFADIVLPNGEVDSRWLTTANMDKATVPQGILSLAKSQLMERCPLLKDGCQS